MIRVDRADLGARLGVLVLGLAGVMPGAQAQLGGPMPGRSASPELAFMSAECVRMAEALRTASPSMRRLPSHQELQHSFQQGGCAAEQQEARRRWQAAQRSDRDQAALRDYETRKQRRDLAQGEVLRSAQCDEMLSALKRRRARVDAGGATAGEQHDLKMFEERFSSRCGQ